MKDCDTCYLGENYECPYMESNPKNKLYVGEDCFAWVKDKADMKEREVACREYRKMMNKKSSIRCYHNRKERENAKV